jgi:uncharacterized repeat protein (TIGR01451 family)
MRTKTKTKTWEVMRRSARHILPVAVLSVSAVFGLNTNDVSAASKAWGPERTTYTWEKPADHVTFNSITNNPSIGDERNFVRLKKVGTDDKYRDSVDLEVGAEYEVAIWFHNDASASLNDSGKGLATNVRLFMDQPNVVKKGQAGEIKGTIHSAEGDPKEVWDTAYVHTNSTVLLRYVANSATIHNNGSANGQILNSDALFGESGAYLAYSTNHWGVVPGCNEYAGYVTYRFKVDQAGFKISKTVSEENQNDYKEEIKVKPGDVLDFKIDYTNTGTINQLQIKAYDHMPNGLSYVSGTSFFKSNVNTAGTFISDNLFNGGANLGDFKPGDTMTLTYKVEVVDDKTIFPCGDTKVYNNASIATENGTGYDKVAVTVHRDCTPDELPKTGPTEIVLATIVVTGLGVGTSYYVASRRQLKKLTDSTK